MSETNLTEPQQNVLVLLAQDSAVSAAAEAVGVHRNTVANWRRGGTAEFRQYWRAAQLEQAEYWRDQMHGLSDLAVDALRRVLTDDTTSASIRLKAALAVLQVASTPAPEPAQPVSSLDHAIEQAGHIPASWRAEAQAQFAAAEASAARAAAQAAGASSNPAQICTSPVSTEVLETYKALLNRAPA